MKHVLEIFGFVLLWVATDIGRTEESKIKFMRGNWWLIFIIIILGTFLITNVDMLLKYIS